MRKPHKDQEVTEVPKKSVKTTVDKKKSTDNRAKPGQRFGGRVKGTPNKVTSLAKDAISMAAEKLGGTDRLVEWVQEDSANERVFWGTIYPKLLPLQVHGDGIAPIMAVTKVVLAPLGEDESED